MTNKFTDNENIDKIMREITKLSSHKVNVNDNNELSSIFNEGDIRKAPINNLFSKIDYEKINDNNIPKYKITNVKHFMNIGILTNNQNLTVISDKYYINDDITLKQIMKFDFNKKKIEFILYNIHNKTINKKKRIYYKSKYKIEYDINKENNSIENIKIKIDPLIIGTIGQNGNIYKNIKPINYKFITLTEYNKKEDSPKNVFKYIYDICKQKGLDCELLLDHNNTNELYENKQYMAEVLTGFLNEHAEKTDITNNIKKHVESEYTIRNHITELEKSRSMYKMYYGEDKKIYELEYRCQAIIHYPKQYDKDKQIYKGYYSDRYIKLIEKLNPYIEEEKQIKLVEDIIPGRTYRKYHFINKEEIVRNLKQIQRKIDGEGKNESKFKGTEVSYKDIKNLPLIQKQEILQNMRETQYQEKKNAEMQRQITYGIKDQYQTEREYDLMEEYKDERDKLKEHRLFTKSNPIIYTSEYIGSFGLLTPYLVSYILRDIQQYNYKLVLSGILNIDESNIISFTKFIHDFKNISISFISLFFQLYNINKMYHYNIENKPDKTQIISQINLEKEIQRNQTEKYYDELKKMRNKLNELSLKKDKEEYKKDIEEYNKTYEINNKKQSNKLSNLDKLKNKNFKPKNISLIRYLYNDINKLIKFDCQYNNLVSIDNNNEKIQMSIQKLIKINIDEPKYGPKVGEYSKSHVSDFDTNYEQSSLRLELIPINEQNIIQFNKEYNINIEKQTLEQEVPDIESFPNIFILNPSDESNKSILDYNKIIESLKNDGQIEEKYDDIMEKEIEKEENKEIEKEEDKTTTTFFSLGPITPQRRIFDYKFSSSSSKSKYLKYKHKYLTLKKSINNNLLLGINE
jgi:hypothetical protein